MSGKEVAMVFRGGHTGMSQDDVSYTLDLSRKEIVNHLVDIASRHFPEPGRRQVPFTLVETLLCYGLFSILDPHHYGAPTSTRFPRLSKHLPPSFAVHPARSPAKC